MEMKLLKYCQLHEQKSWKPLGIWQTKVVKNENYKIKYIWLIG